MATYNLDTPLGAIPMSARARNVLIYSAKADTLRPVSDAISNNIWYLEGLRNCGRQTSSEIKAIISNAGKMDQIIKSPILTKREYFAAMAMQGSLAEQYQNDSGYSDPTKPADEVANASVLYADALIAALNKEEKQ